VPQSKQAPDFTLASAVISVFERWGTSVLEAFYTIAPWRRDGYTGSRDIYPLRRIRLAAKDTALSRRRPRVRIPYALPLQPIAPIFAVTLVGVWFRLQDFATYSLWLDEAWV